MHFSDVVTTIRILLCVLWQMQLNDQGKQGLLEGSANWTAQICEHIQATKEHTFLVRKAILLSKSVQK